MKEIQDQKLSTRPRIYERPTNGEKNLRGLTTVALLKTNFDAGRDHIEMFRPFAEDAIAAFAGQKFTLEAAKQALREKHGLDIPATTLTTLLGRCVRSRVLKKERGEYVVQRPPARPSIEAERRRIDAEHHVLARAMCDFLATNGRPDVTEEGALGMLLEFISEHQIELLLDGEPDATRGAALAPKDTRRVARFVTEICLRDPQLSDFLQRVIEGFVLQNTLLLKDISLADRRFRNLTVYLDSGFVFGALGLLGDSVRIASREGLDLLRSVGAHLAMFDKTRDEMKRILSVYERNLATAEGRSTLHPTELTRFLITHRYKPSDIREMVSLLEASVQALGIELASTPPRMRQFTLDEKDLELRLAHFGRTEMRNIHDVDCVAAILTLRSGRTTDSLDDARAVFATESRVVVNTVQQWYRDHRQGGVAPIIHYIRLSNLAWLKKPASASKLKLQELVALCAAALKPSRKMWDAFLEHLRKLERDGKLTSDEAVAVVASELTDNLLAEVEDSDGDKESLAAVVDRVRTAYEEKARVEAKHLAAGAISEADKRVSQAEATLAAARSAAERDKRQLLGNLEEALGRAGAYEEQVRRVELLLRRRALFWATWVGRAVFAVGTAAIVLATIGTTNAFPPHAGILKELFAGAAVLALIIGGARAIWGGHVTLWQAELTTHLEQRFRKALMGRYGLEVERASMGSR